jgi:transcriptional/translational regulatory protein YebC/TACO1
MPSPSTACNRSRAALDDLDDVQHVHSNFDIPEEEMAKLA